MRCYWLYLSSKCAAIMKFLQTLKPILFSILFAISLTAFAQISPGVYFSDVDNLRYELKLSDSYLIHTVYEKSPAKFIKSVGGFYTMENNMLQVQLEFNSDFQKDSLQTIAILIKLEDNSILFDGESKLTFELQESNSQELDDQWLFANRGPDEGQKRRGESNTRKTLKFLTGGRFQWIAYDTEGMQFKGTGGGSYSAKDGIYTENIEFFSRDNTRVGASLKFNYEIKGSDWHHTGKNSKGEPMYEIWGKRGL